MFERVYLPYLTILNNTTSQLAVATGTALLLISLNIKLYFLFTRMMLEVPPVRRCFNYISSKINTTGAVATMNCFSTI